ncbi:hypothetical protein RFI_04784 [Reticulomyxa filosa]|uniref:Uncharacterized protein n=1 Tax=Reticulomyxa filosa TaxID=46433 RepID=X6P1A2_RETFI|nr:hypothetical protein RFI_04784 [Reticulomyxa filosa]|eukprot:ETO32335.1 hypothetical protein RFI_04784 [Reticulomyxa filosa]
MKTKDIIIGDALQKNKNNNKKNSFFFFYFSFVPFPFLFQRKTTKMTNEHFTRKKKQKGKKSKQKKNIHIGKKKHHWLIHKTQEKK